MPPKTQVNKDFLRQVFANEKRLLKKKQVDYIHVSHYQELSVKNLWKDLKEDVAFNVFFQEKYADEKNPCRKYFFDLLNTIYPEYLQTIMAHATKERFTGEGANKKDEAIKATDEWFEELQSMPFISCKSTFCHALTLLFTIEKSGKTLHLLKASAKKISPNKKRKVIPLLGTIK